MASLFSLQAMLFLLGYPTGRGEKTPEGDALTDWERSAVQLDTHRQPYAPLNRDKGREVFLPYVRSTIALGDEGSPSLSDRGGAKDGREGDTL